MYLFTATSLILPIVVSFNSICNAEFSESLQTLFNSTFQGCILHFILNPKISTQEEILVKVRTFLDTRGLPPAAFFVDIYNPRFRFHAPEILNMGKMYRLLRIEKYSAPRAKYTSCLSQFYLFEEESVLAKIISSYFGSLVLSKGNPHFITFWDLSERQYKISWRKYFSQQEFFGSFKDYRLYIRRDYKTDQFAISFICIPCSLPAYLGPRQNLFTPIVNPTKKYIHQLWRRVNGNLHRLGFICYQCVYFYPKVENFYARLLPEIIGNQLNATPVISSVFAWNWVGFMGETFSLEAVARDFLLIVVFPGFEVSSNFIVDIEFQMTTLYPRNF